MQQEKLPGSKAFQLKGKRPRRYKRAMGKFGLRVKEARLALGMSQSELARRVGITPQAVSSLESGGAQSSRKIKEIAAVLGKTTDWLLGDEKTVLEKPVRSRTIKSGGIVAGGFWQDDTAGQIADEAIVPASPDPKYGTLPQITFRVVGNSMSNLVRDGEWVVCVDYSEHPSLIRDGDVVVAERRRAGQFERTVKRVRMGPGGLELWSDSSDARQQKALPLGSSEDDTEIVVVGLVIGYYRAA